MSNHDKIYLSYIGDLGKDSQNDSKKRIKWILENIESGQQILDLGCSQGIISILAAQKNNHVLGIDIEKDAIDFAENLISNKYVDTKDNVGFICADYYDYHITEKFDVIIMTEVLEHLENPKGFIKKSVQNLKENGRIIITVPFGVNDHPDHKSTFYYTNFLNLLKGIYNIQSISFMGRWLGIVASLSGDNIDIYSPNILRQLEDNFYTIDRKMTDRINELYKYNLSANNKYKESTESYALLKEKYLSLNDTYKILKQKGNETAQKYKVLSENISSIKLRNEEIQAKNDELQAQIGEISTKYKILNSNFISLKKENEETVKAHKAVAEANIVLEEKNKLIDNRYHSLVVNFNSLKSEYQQLTHKCHELSEIYKEHLNGEYLENDYEIDILNNLEKEYKILVSDNDIIRKQYQIISSQYNENLKNEYLSNANEIAILSELKVLVKKLESQNNYLKSENAEYQRKMQIIKDTFVGKILVWGYRKYKSIRIKFSR